MGFRNKLSKSGLIRQQIAATGITLTTVYAEVARIAVPGNILLAGRAFRFELVWENPGSATDNDGNIEQQIGWAATGGAMGGNVLAGLSNGGSIFNSMAPPVPVALCRTTLQTVLRRSGTQTRADSMIEGSIEYEGGKVTVVKRKSEPNILVDLQPPTDIICQMRCLSGTYDVNRIHAFVDMMGELILS